jgi:hypothetical protein
MKVPIAQMREVKVKPTVRNSIRLIVFVAIGISAATLVLIYGMCTYLSLKRGVEARRNNDANHKALGAVIEGLDSYKRERGRYPTTLADLYRNDMRELPRLTRFTQILFKSSESGDRCWVAIDPYDMATTLMPSDAVEEYDSSSRSWTVMDVSDATATWDEQWSQLVGKQLLIPH